MAVVYGLVNTITGKAYIGCTGGRPNPKREYKAVSSKLAKRFREHRCLLNAGTHKEPELQKDWQIYGSQVFKMEVLEELDKFPSAAVKREAELRWMAEYESKGLLYNVYKEAFAFTEAATKAGIEASRHVGRWRNGVPADHGKKISEGRRRARKLRQLKDIV
ncbi:MAG TPA: hypothetical protein VFR24_27435 [Candidatus Angelobacter sp.]|nr:hypothetical protein [Candidatus Angelobacter sp.]